MKELRQIVACTTCERQYDASELQVGDKFHCSCGAVVQVPPPRPHEAAVVRCSSCGAPRQEGARACRFCDADFTLHERDLNTICPKCMTRISNRSRYCHSCATPMVVEELVSELSDRLCPVCGDHALRSRRLSGGVLSAMECDRCAGLWIGNEAFDKLVAHARQERRSTDGLGSVNELRSPLHHQQTGPLYRSCPRCGKRMNRRNYGKRSGIIIDLCKSHGIWFDGDELERVLRWVRHGGEDLSREVDQEELRAEASRVRVQQKVERADWPLRGVERQRSPALEMLGGLGLFLTSVRELFE